MWPGDLPGKVEVYSQADKDVFLHPKYDAEAVKSPAVESSAELTLPKYLTTAKIGDKLTRTRSGLDLQILADAGEILERTFPSPSGLVDQSQIPSYRIILGFYRRWPARHRRP